MYLCSVDKMTDRCFLRTDTGVILIGDAIQAACV